MLAAVIPTGRIVAQFDLYAVTFSPVAHPDRIAVPDEVQIDEVSDKSLYVHHVGACFVGSSLDQRGA